MSIQKLIDFEQRLKSGEELNRDDEVTAEEINGAILKFQNEGLDYISPSMSKAHMVMVIFECALQVRPYTLLNFQHGEGVDAKKQTILNILNRNQSMIQSVLHIQPTPGMTDYTMIQVSDILLHMDTFLGQDIDTYQDQLKKKRLQQVPRLLTKFDLFPISELQPSLPPPISRRPPLRPDGRPMLARQDGGCLKTLLFEPSEKNMNDWVDFFKTG